MSDTRCTFISTSAEQLDKIYLSWAKFRDVQAFLNVEFATQGIAIPDQWQEALGAGDVIEFQYNGATISMALMCRLNDTFGFQLYDVLNAKFIVNETVPYNDDYKDVLRKYIELLKATY